MDQDIFAQERAVADRLDTASSLAEAEQEQRRLYDECNARWDAHDWPGFDDAVVAYLSFDTAQTASRVRIALAA